MDRTLQFAQPLWLILGPVLIAGMLGIFAWADRRRRRDLGRLAHPRFHARLVAGFSPGLRWVRRSCWLLGALLLAVAAGRPQYGYEWREVKRRGIDILFAVDTSRSMLAEDLPPNRLERARLGILDFVQHLEGDRVGLVPFAGTAFALCPLTLDYDAFRESLDSLSPDLIPQQGSDLASAIREADRLFDQQGNNQRFLVLLTDGEDLEGEVLEAAKEAASHQTTIYTVGVGEPAGSFIPIRGRRGEMDFVRDERGEKVQTKLDEEMLRKIADETQGLYVPLGRGAEGLETIYRQRLSLAPKSELAQQMEKVPVERFQWPLGAALSLLVLQAVMGERRREKKKQGLPSVARRIRPAVPLLLALAAWALPQGGEAQPVDAYKSGTEAYAKGEFQAAADRLRESLATADLGLQQKAYYNLGNSLYRIGQATVSTEPKKTIERWQEAVKAYEDALALEGSDADALYNRDLVKRKLEELKQQQNQQNQNQQQDQKQDSKDQKDPKDQKDQQQQGGGKGDSKDQQQSQKDPGDSKDSQDSQGKSGSGDKPQDQQPQNSKDGQGKQEQSDDGSPQKGDRKQDDQGKNQPDEKGQQGEEPKEEGDQESKGAGDKPKGQEDKSDPSQGQGQEPDKQKPEQEQPGKSQDSQSQEGKDGKQGQDGKEPGDPQSQQPQSAPEGQSADGQAGKQGGAAGEGWKDTAAGGARAVGTRQPGEMSREEARRLLETLSGDERVVVPVPLSEQNRNRRGGAPNRKTW